MPKPSARRRFGSAWTLAAVLATLLAAPWPAQAAGPGKSSAPVASKSKGAKGAKGGTRRAGAATKKAAPKLRPSLRIRAASRLGRKARLRSKRIPPRRWIEHPAARAAMLEYRGQQPPGVKEVKFAVKARFKGREHIGYLVSATSIGFDGKVSETALEVDLSGAIIARGEAGSPFLRRGGGAGKARRARLAELAGRLPGTRRLRARREAKKRARKELIRESFPEREKTLADQAADPHIREVMSYSHHDKAVIWGVSDLHTGTGENSPNEDFRNGTEPMVELLAKANEGDQRTTLVAGGDIFDAMENLPINADLATKKKVATEIIEGHAAFYRGLTRAVVPKIKGKQDLGLRVIYARGNHDIQTVEKAFRDHLVSEMARVGGLKRAADIATFKARVAFTGDMAVLGRRGELVVLHGDVHDPSNNWRAMSNPYQYSVTRQKRGKPPRVERRLESNMGYTIVENLYRYVEAANPTADNTAKATAWAVGKQLLTSRRARLRLIRVLWKLLGQRGTESPVEQEMARADDALVREAWAERTGVAELWNLPGADAVVERLDQIRNQMPRSVRDQMSSRFRVVNLFKMIFGGAKRVSNEAADAEARLIGLLTTALPVDFADLGHTHDQSRLAGTVKGRKVVTRNLGTWTTRKGQDTFTVAVTKMGAGGRLVEKGLFAADARGELNKIESPPAPEWIVPGWSP